MTTTAFEVRVEAAIGASPPQELRRRATRRFIALAAAALVGFSSVAAASGVVDIVRFTGDVKVGDEQLEEGKTYQVPEGAVIETGEDGNVFGKFPDGSQLRVKEDSLVAIAVVDPGEGQTHRLLDLNAGTIEYLADPSATVQLRIATSRGNIYTRDADVSVRVDSAEGENELACVIAHNIDHTSTIEGRPDVIMSILKEEVEITGINSASMGPGSVLVLCPRLRRTIDEAGRHAIETSAEAIPVVTIQEASPFQEVTQFEF